MVFRSILLAVVFVWGAACGDDGASKAIVASCDDLCSTQVSLATDCGATQKTNCVNLCKAAYAHGSDACANAMKAVAKCYRDNQATFSCDGGDLPGGMIPDQCQAAVTSQGSACQ